MQIIEIKFAFKVIETRLSSQASVSTPIEEMEATREESEQQQKEMENVLQAIDNTTGRFELDLNGNILKVNKSYQMMIKQKEDSKIKPMRSLGKIVLMLLW